MDRTPKVLLAGEGQKLQIRNEIIFVKLAGAETGGACAVTESWTPPGGGPPLHRHTREDESFYVLEGDYEFTIGGQTVHAPAGTFLFGARGIPHSFKNIGAKQARILALIQPAGLEKLFEEASERLCSGKADPAQMAALFARYGIEYLP